MSLQRVAAGRPPTTNLLLNAERRQMMRSARKLGEIFGTTPILDATELLPSMDIILPALDRRSSKREGIVVTNSSFSSTTSSFDSDLKKSIIQPTQRSFAKLTLSPDARNSISDAMRLRLVLTLAQPMPATSQSEYSHSGNSTGTAPVDTLKRSLSILISAEPSDPSSDHAARRRKMVKLVHILGGPIPPALVFPPASTSGSSRGRTSRVGIHSRSNSHSRARTSRRRSRSVPPPSAYAFAAPQQGPRKLVRPPPAEAEPELPKLTVDLISHPRPLAPFTSAAEAGQRSRSHSRPVSRGTTGTMSSAGSHSAQSYSLRRRARESTRVLES